MKKIILVAILTSLISCSKSSKNNPPAEETYFLEGTVVKIFNLLIPSAQAAVDTNFAILLGSLPADTGSLPEDVIGVDCPADRCAFLITSGEKVGVKNHQTPKLQLISHAPVKDGKFSFALKKGDNPLYEGSGSRNNPIFRGLGIYKVVVRGWDNVAKLPLSKSGADREIVLSNDEIADLVSSIKGEGQPMEITPETTVAARKRVEVLKSNRSLSDSSIIDSLKSLFGQVDESIRDLSLRLVTLIMGEDSQEKELLTSLVNNPIDIDEDISSGRKFLMDLQVKMRNSPLSELSDEGLLDAVDEINSQIIKINGGQINQMAKYPLEGLVSSSEDYILSYSQLRELMFNLEANPDNADLKASVAAKELSLDEPTDLILDSCPAVKVIKNSKGSISRLEDIKASISLEGEKYDELRDILSAALIPVELSSIIDDRDEALMISACTAATDFNTTRSNRQR